jgi:hypothetical protein
MRTLSSHAASGSGGLRSVPRLTAALAAGAIMLTAGLLPRPVAAQQAGALTLRDAPGSVVIGSALPVAVAVMLTDDGTEGRHASVVVPARGTATLPRRATSTYRIVRMEPINWTVPIRNAPRCQGDTGARAEHLAALRRDVARLTANTEEEAERRSTLATQIAQLEIDAERDRRNTERYNALAMEIRRQYFRDNPTGTAYEEQDRQQATEDFATTLAELNTVFAAGDDAKRGALDTEATHLRALAAQGDSALERLRVQFGRADEHARAGLAFLRLVSEQLQARPAGSGTQVRVTGPLRRSCSGAAGVEDYLELTAVPTDPRTNVILAEARFNGGVVQQTAFRRVEETDRWVATVFWPVRGEQVQVRVHTDGAGWQRVDGAVSPGRLSLENSRRETERAIAEVRRQASQARFRAEGGDGVKTIIIP